MPGAARDVLKAAGQLLAACAAWLVGFPLTLILKRDPGLVVVIGRRGPVFADNSKYFFVYATATADHGKRVVFFTDDRCVQQAIAVAGGKAVRHPSGRSLWMLLRCHTVVCDMADWIEYGAYPLTHGAKRVQLWHGAPLKYIELDQYRRRLLELPAWARPLLHAQKKLAGRHPKYDAVLTTSKGFTADAFTTAFKTRQFISAGYPRNDILFAWPKSESTAYRLAWLNVDRQAMERVAAERALGKKICLYVPTFRKDLANPFDSEIDLSRLSGFASRHDLIVVLKLHPAMHGRFRLSDHANLLEYAPLGDVYPLMTLSDLLITDYSSIFFDYLLLDRPILFFAYDLESYLSRDRAMYFEYDAITPGTRCTRYEDLESAIERILANNGLDGYETKRAKVRAYCHDHRDGQAADRLFNELGLNT
jgi:CDP-glycerol glycerophosphotransferase